MLENVLQVGILLLISIISGFWFPFLSIGFLVSFILLLFYFLGMRTRLRSMYKEDAMYIIALREFNVGLILCIISILINVCFSIRLILKLLA